MQEATSKSIQGRIAAGNSAKSFRVEVQTRREGVNKYSLQRLPRLSYNCTSAHVPRIAGPNIKPDMPELEKTALQTIGSSSSSGFKKIETTARCDVNQGLPHYRL